MGSILSASDLYQLSLFGRFPEMISVPSGISASASMISPAEVFISTQGLLNTTISKNIYHISDPHVRTTFEENEPIAALNIQFTDQVN